MADIVYSNIRVLNKQLAMIESESMKQLRKDAKNFAKPVQMAVKSALPTISSIPLSGALHAGRTGALGDINLGKMSIRYKASGSKRANITSLVSVRVESPFIAMIDMAGKKNLVRKAVTREYPYKGGSRKHRVTTQGKSMISNLSGSPSRFIWPAAEKAIPEAQRNILFSLEQAAKKINGKLK